MKTLLSIIIALFLFQCSSSNKDANENFVSICKLDANTFKIIYLDSMRGITKISSTIKGDTLNLIMYVSVVKKQKDQIIRINKDVRIKYVCFGNKRLVVDKIPNCSKVRSNKQAFDYIDHLKKD